MPTLRSQIDALAAHFADQVVSAIRGASLQELIGAHSAGPAARRRGGGAQPAPASTPKAAPKGKPGRLKRRSDEDIAAALAKVVGLVKKHAAGLRAEEIRANLGLEAKELPRVLKEGLSSKVLTKKGQKRATAYFAR
jgi:uncharacterized protein YejL (UPF0352 family)